MNTAEIIDFHTHAFPDPVAARAVPALEKAGNVQACADGTVSGLLASMDRANFEKSVICSIATRVEQFQPILDWSKQIRSSRLVPLPSVHPEDPNLADHVKTIKEQGFIGIKMHPYYQNFFLAEDRLTELYQTVTDCGLLLVVHTGFDIAYPRDRRADPAQVIKVVKKFPDLKLITTHLGGWDDWDEVKRLLIGKPVYMEISFALHFLSRTRARNLITAHQPDYILFGTDSPWADQTACLQQLKELELDKSLYEKIVRKNAARLLL
jgi:predicted TIM-barrel fold metal-dependent hydrolase